MTLILTLGNSEQVIQVSDRRLSWDGRLRDDESSKAGLLTCLNARLAFGFTGLATWRSFCTRDWLLDALMDSGPPEYAAAEVLERLRTRASETFRTHAELSSAPRKDRRLSIMFSGYLHHHDPPLGACAILTNFQDFQTHQDNDEARDDFSIIWLKERRPFESEPTLIQRIGSWRAMTRDDEVQLRDLLAARKPAEAIIGKAVDLVRKMADRPAAKKTIGKQLSVLCLPRDPSGSVGSGHYSDVNSYYSYMHDGVLLRPSDSWAIKDIQIKKVERPGTVPIGVRKVGRNNPCPCGNGKKYKQCHGKRLPA